MIEVGYRCHIPDSVMAAHVRMVDCRKMLCTRRCWRTDLTRGSYDSEGKGMGWASFEKRLLGIALTGIHFEGAMNVGAENSTRDHAHTDVIYITWTVNKSKLCQHRTTYSAAHNNQGLK